MEFQEIACTSHQWKAVNLANRGQQASSSSVKQAARTSISAVPTRAVFQLQVGDEAAKGSEGKNLV